MELLTIGLVLIGVGMVGAFVNIALAVVLESPEFVFLVHMLCGLLTITGVVISGYVLIIGFAKFLGI